MLGDLKNQECQGENIFNSKHQHLLVSYPMGKKADDDIEGDKERKTNIDY